MSYQDLINDIRNIPVKEKIIILASAVLILALPLLITVSTENEKQNTRSQAAETEIDSLNTQILENNRAGNAETNRFLLEQRKVIMSKLAYENPQEFLNKAMTPDLRNSFPEDQRGLIEEKVDLTGTLVPYHSDNFEDRVAKTGYFIQTSDSTISISFDAMPSEESLGSAEKVLISGYMLGNHIVAKKSDIQILTTAVDTTTAVGDKRYVVLPINFTDDRSTPYTKTEMLKFLFCIPSCDESLRTYYRKVSDRKINISGQVSAVWLQSPFKEDEVCNNSDVDNLLSWAKGKVPIAFTPYTNGVIFVYSHNGCNWGGMGTIGGSPSIALIGEYDLRILSHEIGHNLGINHASTLGRDCLKDPFCRDIDEYGDGADTMGFDLANLNGPHLRALGILPKSMVRSTNQGGIFTVHKLGSNVYPELIRINLPSGTDWFIEYRANRAGYDSNSPYKLGAGILLHSWGNINREKTYLFDVFDHDPVFRDGDVVSVPGYYKVKQLTHENDSAKIKIIKN